MIKIKRGKEAVKYLREIKSTLLGKFPSNIAGVSIHNDNLLSTKALTVFRHPPRQHQ